MAPTTSFLRLTSQTVIPTRSFINRREVQKNILETSVYPEGKEKSIQLKLSRVQRITLSNNDLRKLYGELHEKLFKILFEFDEQELDSLNKFSQKDLESNDTEINAVFRGTKMLKLPLMTEHWRCYLVISLEDLVAIRGMMTGSDLADYAALKKHNVIYNNLLVRELAMGKAKRSKVVVNLDSDEEIPEELNVEDSKKDLRVKYKGRYIIPIPLNIHIYARN
ncbi:DEKNAAC100144 [Brettanomyces naardenensis]|uniref:DEKNAAC100145 n=1 Tax=Brettanomyces naardenensis TaxID=13370 RepID=A0A448YFU9_BRENA|nr:DEKNAAC100144 [Brettanomyces naardenensis]